MLKNIPMQVTICKRFKILFHAVYGIEFLMQPSLTLNYVVAQLLVFPVGRLWERLPTWRVGFGQWTFRINPGRFHVKECICFLQKPGTHPNTDAVSFRHAIIVICVNLTATTAYAMGSLVAITSEEFWGQDYGAGFGILYILTTQFLGYVSPQSFGSGLHH